MTRVASQVVVGIGFLGAGIIFRERASISNPTTAVNSCSGSPRPIGLDEPASATSVPRRPPPRCSTLALLALLLRCGRTSADEPCSARPCSLPVLLVDGGVGVGAGERRPGPVPGIEVDRVRIGKAGGRPTISMRMRGGLAGTSTSRRPGWRPWTT